MITLFDHQLDVVKRLKKGRILWGSVGSGKSIAALAYYIYSCSGVLIKNSKETRKITDLKRLYIITTAKKRDSKEWEKDYSSLGLSKKFLIVDSWNNIEKYKNIENCFFIFDEQKVIGSGSWSKSFIAISKNNDWILATATPGDVWLDYAPVFIANGYFRNRTDFTTNHVVYSPYSKFPKIQYYVGIEKLEALKKQILIEMPYENKTISLIENIKVSHNRDLYLKATKTKWNVYKEEPIKQVSELYYVWRRIVNSDSDRLTKLRVLLEKHRRLIVFYNFDYELEILRSLSLYTDFEIKEYNGHKHDDLPESKSWIYLVQYTAGSEAWNCTTTNTVVFYSLNYSYKITSQAGGRIDRANTPFSKLYYYYFVSDSPIDSEIISSLIRKEEFNERKNDLKMALA